jgi:hypothetical protein
VVASTSEQVSAERHLYSALQRAAVDQSDWAGSAFDNTLGSRELYELRSNGWAQQPLGSERRTESERATKEPYTYVGNETARERASQTLRIRAHVHAALARTGLAAIWVSWSGKYYRHHVVLRALCGAHPRSRGHSRMLFKVETITSSAPKPAQPRRQQDNYKTTTRQLQDNYKTTTTTQCAALPPSRFPQSGANRPPAQAARTVAAARFAAATPLGWACGGAVLLLMMRAWFRSAMARFARAIAGFHGDTYCKSHLLAWQRSSPGADVAGVRPKSRRGCGGGLPWWDDRPWYDQTARRSRRT